MKAFKSSLGKEILDNPDSSKQLLDVLNGTLDKVVHNGVEYAVFVIDRRGNIIYIFKQHEGWDG